MPPTRIRNGLRHGPRGWRLAPEGAAIHLATQTAVIADVHLGYEWARASGGDMVPAHSLAETLAKLEGLLHRTTIARLVVAGDLVESFTPCVRTGRDVASLRRWLDHRGVALLGVKGDHDRRGAWPETLEIDGWTVAHGSRPVPGHRWIGGHFHPAIRGEGRSFPCVLIGPDRIVLPAFSANASGLDIRSAALPEGFPSLRCLAAAGDDWLDFGPVASLRAGWLGSTPSSSERPT